MKLSIFHTFNADYFSKDLHLTSIVLILSRTSAVKFVKADYNHRAIAQKSHEPRVNADS